MPTAAFFALPFAVVVTPAFAALFASPLPPRCPETVGLEDVRALLRSGDPVGARSSLNCYLLVMPQDSDARRLSSDLFWRAGEAGRAEDEAGKVLNDPLIGSHDEPRQTLVRRFARVRGDLGLTVLTGKAYEGTEAIAGVGARIGKATLRANVKRASRSYAGERVLIDSLYGVGGDAPLGEHASVTIDATSNFGHKNLFLPRFEVGATGNTALWPAGKVPVEAFGGVRFRSYASAGIPALLAGFIFPAGESLRAEIRGDAALHEGVVANGTGILFGDPFAWFGASLGVTAGETVEDARRKDRFVEIFAQARFELHPRFSLRVDAARYRGRLRDEGRLGATATCFL